MSESDGSVDAIARVLTEQCRREIDAAWIHVEAGKDILRRSRWLLKRWEEQRRLIDEQVPVLAPRAAEMFVVVEPARRQAMR